MSRKLSAYRISAKIQYRASLVIIINVTVIIKVIITECYSHLSVAKYRKYYSIKIALVTFYGK